MRYAGTFQMNDSGSYIVTAKQKDGEHKQMETVTLSYPAEYATFDVNVNLLKKLSEDIGGIFEPSLSEIVAPAGTPFEKRVSLSQTLLIIAVALFVLEMILRRFSIASGYFAELRSQLRRQSEAVVPETLTQLTQKKLMLILLLIVVFMQPWKAHPQANTHLMKTHLKQRYHNQQREL